MQRTPRRDYLVQGHPAALGGRDLACLLLELATGWMDGSSFHSALIWLATPKFMYKESLHISYWAPSMQGQRIELTFRHTPQIRCQLQLKGRTNLRGDIYLPDIP